MPLTPIDTEKVVKTGVLFAGVNILGSTLYLFDSKIGLLGTLAINTALIHHLNELGKENRVGQNVAHKTYSFFAGQINLPTHHLENLFRNIIAGGAAVANDIAHVINESKRPSF